MGILFLENTRKAIIHIFTMVGYSERMMPIIGYANIFFQFVCFYAMKIMNQKSGLNQELLNVSQLLSQVLVSQFFFFFGNLIISLLILAVTIAAVIVTKKSEQEQLNSKKFSNLKNIYWFISRFFTLLRFLFLPCLVTNLNGFNGMIQNTSPNIFSDSKELLAIAIINVCIIAVISLFYSQGMLLGRWTFVVVFLSLEFGFVDIIMKLISIVALLTHSLKKPPFERILIRLLLFVFVMDFLAFTASVSISLLHFVIFNVFIVLGELVRPEERFLTQVESQNEVLIEILQKLNKGKRLQKKQEITLLTVIFKNKEKIEQFTNYFSSANCINTKELFQNVDIYSFEWLSGFFKLKLEINIKQYSNSLILKLQEVVYSLKYQKITIKMLIDIVRVSRQAANQIGFRQKILMMQIQQLIKEKHFKKKQQVHSFELLSISKKVELFYKAFFETIQIMPSFWYRLKLNTLSEDQLFQILKAELKKEQKMKSLIEDIMIYKSTKPQVKLFDYAMRLLNFDYEPKMLRKGEIQFGNSQLASSHYIYLTENKITDVSNRVLVESKWKREQIIDENFDILIPHQLKNYLQGKLENALQNVKDPPQFILPFIQMRQFLLPYKIKIDVKFNLSSGIIYVIHFIKSQELQQSPSFLYCFDSDQIMNFCPLFKQYIKLHKRKVSAKMLGSQLFTIDLSHQIIQNGKKVNDKIICALKRQKEYQENIPIVFSIKNIYVSGPNRYALIQIQRKYVENLAKYETIENLICVIEQQKNTEVRNYRQNIKNQDFFCKITNPYQSLINQKMNKLNLNCRKSNPKIIIAIILLFFCLFCGSVIFINQQVGIMASFYKNLVSLSSQDTTQKEQIYLLPYLLYHYFQIKNFPSSLLKIQNYNLSELTSSYFEKVNQHISILSSYPFQNLVLNNANYTLVYPNYSKQMQTSSTSIIDFMTIAKKSLVTNNANFVIRNQFALDIIVRSYKKISMMEFSSYMAWVETILIGFIAGFVLLAILILALILRTRLLARQLFKIYTKITKKQVDSCIQKYQQLLEAGKYELYTDKKMQKKHGILQLQSDYTLLSQAANKIKADNFQSDSQHDKLFNQADRNQNQNELGIKTDSNGKLILKYSYLLGLPLLCCTYFFIYLTDIQTYYNNASLVLQKNYNLKNSIVTIVKKAEKFYQASMLQQVTPNASNTWKIQSKSIVDINFDIELPPQFSSYMVWQKNIVNYDLCAHLEPNKDSLYSNINCYDILDGIMKKGLTQTFILYSNLIEAYGGTMMSQFNNVYRQNAKYPVFMQIIYIRQVVCDILSKLQSQYYATTLNFIDSQNKKVKGDLLRGLVVVPLLFVFIIYVIYTIYNESNAVIKAFRVLPKSFLLNIKTTKFLKNQEILDKIQMIPL